MACPRELFSSWMPQPNPGPAFWCSCPRLNADRTLPPAPIPEQDTTPGRGQESLRAPASVTRTPSQSGRVVARQAPGCGWRREYLQERVLCPLPPKRVSPCLHPATQLEWGPTQGRPGPCTPAERLLLSQEGPAPPAAPGPTAWPGVPTPEATRRECFQASPGPWVLCGPGGPSRRPGLEDRDRQRPLRR